MPGRHRSRKWIAANGDPRKFKTVEEVVNWVEAIPFEETQNYVQRVIENLQLYRHILNPGQHAQVNTSRDLMR